MFNEVSSNNEIFQNYYDKIDKMIKKSKESVIRNINHEMVELYYNI